MGSLTEHFANLSELLLSEFSKDPLTEKQSRRQQLTGVLERRLLRPWLPASVRCGPGIIVDIKDRQVGPFDAVACSEAYPPLGDGMGTLYMADGVSFCLQARDWSQEDLTGYGELCGRLKKLERKNKMPIFCGAISFELLAMEQVTEFLTSPGGQGVDAVLSVGHNAVLRNSQGWYGEPDRIPFVTQRGAAESLKSFMLFLLHLAQSSVGQPFAVSDYQHL